METLICTYAIAAAAVGAYAIWVLTDLPRRSRRMQELDAQYQNRKRPQRLMQ
jgi:hypothetical protein